jgi:hypothetical protein
VRARGSGVRRLCHGQELTAAAGPRPKRNRAEERQCCVRCAGLAIRLSSLCVPGQDGEPPAVPLPLKKLPPDSTRKV